MPLTIEFLENLRANGGMKQREGDAKDGRWRIDPPLKVTALCDGYRGEAKMIEVGQQYEVSQWGESGKYQGLVHLEPTAAFWWHMSTFEPI